MEDKSIMEQGLSYYKEGKFSQAIEEFNKLDDKVAAEHKGNCYYKQGNIGEAVKQWDKVEVKNEIINRRLVDCFVRMKKFDMLLSLRNHLGKDSVDLVTYINGLNMWKGENKKLEAIKLLSQVKGIPECGKQLEKLKNEMYDLQLKIRQFEKKISYGTATKEDKMELAILYYENQEGENINKAIKIFQSVVEEGESLSAPYKYLGLCCQALNKQDEARTFWANGAVIEPKDPEILYLLAEIIYEQVKGFQKQIDQKEIEIEETEPNSDEYHSLENKLYELKNEKQNYLDMAIGNLEEIKKRPGNCFKSFLLRGEIEEFRAEWKDAHFYYSSYLMKTGINDPKIEEKKKKCFLNFSNYPKSNDKERNSTKLSSNERLNNDSTQLGLVQFSNELYVSKNNKEYLFQKLPLELASQYSLLYLKVKDFDHDNIMSYLVLDKDNISMPFYLGGSLYDYIHIINNNDTSSLPYDTKKQMIHQICSGLAYLEEKELYHPQLNPHNIFLKSKFSNFEIPLLLIGDYFHITPSKRHLNWINPNEDTPKSHIYQLKLIIYEILTGKVPFEDIIQNNKCLCKESILKELSKAEFPSFQKNISKEVVTMLTSNDPTLTIDQIKTTIDNSTEVIIKQSQNLYLIENLYCKDQDVFIEECKASEQLILTSPYLLKRKGWTLDSHFTQWKMLSEEDVNLTLHSYISDPDFNSTDAAKVNIILQIVLGILEIQEKALFFYEVKSEFIVLKKPFEAYDNSTVLKIINYYVTEKFSLLVEKKIRKKGKGLMTTFILLCIEVCCHTDDALDEFCSKPKKFMKNNAAYFPGVIKEIIDCHLKKQSLDFEQMKNKLTLSLN